MDAGAASAVSAAGEQLWPHCCKGVCSHLQVHVLGPPAGSCSEEGTRPKGRRALAHGAGVQDRLAPRPASSAPSLLRTESCGGRAAVPLACCLWGRSKRETHLLQGATRESLSQDTEGGGSKNPGAPREGEENVWGPGSYVSAKKWSAADEGGYRQFGYQGDRSGGPSLRPRCTGPAQD